MANKELLKTIRKEIISRIDKRHLSAQAKNELVSLLSFLDTLESEKPMNQEGLEKEMNRYFNAWQNVLCEEDCCNEGGFCCVLNDELKPVNLFHCRKIARHFFDLGLNARKV